MTILYDLLNEAEKTLEESHDYYINIVVSVIPHVYEGLNDKSALEFKNLIDGIEKLMKKRNMKYLDCIKPLR